MDTQLKGELEGIGQSHLTIYGIAAIVETWDWPDHAVNAHWLARGKKRVWFDYLALLERGMNGAELEEKLGRLRVVIYGKMYAVQDDGVWAYVLVDKNRVSVAKNMLAKTGVLIA